MNRWAHINLPISEKSLKSALEHINKTTSYVHSRVISRRNTQERLNDTAVERKQ